MRAADCVRRHGKHPQENCQLGVCAVRVPFQTTKEHALLFGVAYRALYQRDPSLYSMYTAVHRIQSSSWCCAVVCAAAAATNGLVCTVVVCRYSSNRSAKQLQDLYQSEHSQAHKNKTASSGARLTKSVAGALRDELRSIVRSAHIELDLEEQSNFVPVCLLQDADLHPLCLPVQPTNGTFWVVCATECDAPTLLSANSSDTVIAMLAKRLCRRPIFCPTVVGRRACTWTMTQTPRSAMVPWQLASQTSSLQGCKKKKASPSVP